MWLYKLGHIRPKCISKLHKECESCLLGKITKVPFIGHSERVTELLGIIHNNVCGPMTVHSRYREVYFITSTNDFNRYDYLFIMKHEESFISLSKDVKFAQTINNKGSQIVHAFEYVAICLWIDMCGEWAFVYMFPTFFKFWSILVITWVIPWTN